MRVYVGGATGVFTPPIAGWWHVASGLFDTVLVVAEEKMSSAARPHPQYVFRYIWDPPIVEKPPLDPPNLIWIFAMEMHRYMNKYGVKKEDIASSPSRTRGTPWITPPPPNCLTPPT